MRVQSGLSSARLRPPTRGRAGYTLVELVVVMGIIAALAALILGAVSKAKDVGDRTKVRAELSQLDTATAAFKKDFGFNPPQYVEFPDLGETSPAPGSAKEKGARLLQKMFRGYTPGLVAVKFRGAPTAANQSARLSGIQSLVFFLSGPTGTGFEKTQPRAALVDSNSKVAPYYEFPEARFIDPEDRTGPNVYDYRDVYGTAYAYFSSGTAGGDKYESLLLPPAQPSVLAWPIPDRTGSFLAPFRTSKRAITDPSFTRADLGAWLNPGRVQIISAGPDKTFGQVYLAPTNATSNDGGNVWIPGQNEYSDLGTPSFGADDLANFNGTAPLGVAGN